MYSVVTSSSEHRLQRDDAPEGTPDRIEPVLYVSVHTRGSSDRSKAFADGEVSRRSADSSDRMSDSRWKSPAYW